MKSPIYIHRLRLILALLFTIWMHPAIAADITITLKEKGDGTHIEGGTVVINDGEVYDSTNEAGNVQFTNIDTLKNIKVLAPGYETLLLTNPPNEPQIALYLEPLVLEQEGLEVTAERLVEKTSKISLSAPELTKAAGSGGDPIKALTSLPGIVPTEEGSAQVYMRGSNANENITWVNGAPVGYLYHFSGFQSTIHPALVDDINVFLGGFPVKYGDALGGVMDVRLREPKKDRQRYNFDISTIASSFLVEGPAGKTNEDSFFVAGRRSYIDLILSPGKANEAFEDEDDEDPDQIILVPRFYDFQALYRHQLARGHVDSYFFAAGDATALEIRDSAKSDPQLAGKARDKIEYQTAGLTWEQQWNNNWDSLTTVAYIHEKSSSKVGRDDEGNPFYARVEENTLYLQPELRKQLDSSKQFSFGLSSAYADIPVDAYAPRTYREDDPNFDFTSQKKFRLKKTLYAHEVSPFIQLRQQWTDRLTTQVGLRHTNINVTGGFNTHKFSPRLNLEYQATPSTLLTAAWGKYIQMPEGEEIVESFGNPSLLMTEAEHRILGIEHQITPLYNIKAEVYHKPMKNLVIALDENDPPDNYANKGTGEAYGFDLFIKRKQTQGKMGWLSLSWARSRRTNEITGITRDFSGDQPLTLTAVWGQPFGGSWKRWDWSIKAQVHSGRPYTAVTGRHREDPDDPDSRWIAEYGKHNAERLPNYYKVDLRIGRKFLLRESNVKFYLDLQNITFAKNIVEYDYGNEYERIDNPKEITGMGFFPYIGVEMEL